MRSAPRGGTDFKLKNFRRAEMIGEQLALAGDAAARRRRDRSRTPRVSYAVQPFYTLPQQLRLPRARWSSTPQRAAGSSATNRRRCYNCPLTGPKTAATCESDDFAVAQTDPIIGAEYRNGDHLRSAVEYVRIGPVGMMFLPGEIPGELTVGLPGGVPLGRRSSGTSRRRARMRSVPTTRCPGTSRDA